ncbi:MAG: hypothetical protein IPP07_23905 [Holophagales bacterium]|nr:hypothetical protein [Holophagales bacterium]
MTSFAAGTGLAFFFSFAFVLLYALLSAFAQALESLSSIRRKSLLEGQEGSSAGSSRPTTSAFRASP